MQNIKVLPTKEDLIAAAANLVLRSASAALSERDRFSLALSGGSTPLPLYEYLIQGQSDHKLDWHKVHFFWGDERMVPPDHPESNFYQAYQTLLKPRNIAENNIHRVQGELEPALSAEKYRQELIDWFQEPLPNFDLILLGLGSDGHTASLFPGTKAFDCPQDYDLIAPNYVPQLDTWRITFTAKLINAAKQILFLVSGQSKADILFKVLEDPTTRDQYPAQSIRPTNGELIWLVDQEAGLLLTPASLNR
jgi:6-phosphogluconolactonase